MSHQKRLKDVYKRLQKITHPDKLKGLSDFEDKRAVVVQSTGKLLVQEIM